MSDELSQRLERVRRSALRGARSATRSAQLIDFAVERTVEKFEDAMVRDRVIERDEAWAFRVARNTAVAAVRGGGHRRVGLEEQNRPASAVDQAVLPPATRRQLKRWLRRHRERLSAYQLDVVRLMADGHSYRSAAKVLDKDRTNLKRAFRRALQQLKRVRRSRSTAVADTRDQPTKPHCTLSS
jgi:DNA-directed RNA polymerase specialized sigma24 family protein